jgi:hypothetical protein
MTIKLKQILSGSLLASVLMAPAGAYAGNPDRAGSAGAQELLINPFARSSGWGGANSSKCRGLESMFLNVAGIAFTKKTEVSFARTSWLGGSGININNFGFTQHVGETGALGINVMALNAGQIPVTTVDNPEGGLGTFNPLFINIGISYAKGFSDNIYGGATVRIIQEQISNVQAKGVALDAGIQYHTGKYDQIHFGISLRNVGPKMSYRGDGLSFEANVLNGNQYNYQGAGYTATFENRSAAFELPSLVNIGGAYDFYLTKDSAGLKKDHRLTVAGNFTSNSFTNDQYIAGVEYGFKQYFMVRGGYVYENGVNKEATRRTAYTGPTMGVTLELPFGKEKQSSFALDYSYRFTNPFSGTHCIGARINL